MRSIANLEMKIRDARKVVIVHPFTYVNPYSILPPVAAEYLQAGVIETGREAVLLDMRFETDASAQIKDADIVCLCGHFENCGLFGKWNFHVIDEVLAQVPDGTPVIAGGTGFTDVDKTFEDYPVIDILLRGSPESIIMELFEKGSPEGVANLAYRTDGKTVCSPRAAQQLSNTVYPRRKLRNPAYRYHVAGMKLDLVRAAVGCNFRCSFCYRYGKDFDGEPIPWAGRSAQSLFNELSEIDAQIVGWVDDDMTTDMQMLSDLADLLIKNKVRKMYCGTGRLDHVVKTDVATLKKLERSGLVALSFGVESLKPETLRLYRKGLSIEKIEKAMQMMKQTNILLICNFIFGSPGETEEDMMKMLWFGRKWNVDTIVTNRMDLHEGVPLYADVYDPATGLIRPGMEMLTGDELAAIKYRVKFSQRGPLRIQLTLLKLYRHRGVLIDPWYAACSAFETAIRHTILEKTLIVPALLKVTKFLVNSWPIHQLLRLLAFVLTPPTKALMWVLAPIDRALGVSTTVLPKMLLHFTRTVYKKQKEKSQLRSEA